MVESILEEDVTRSTSILKKNIDNLLKEQLHGIVNGYLIMDESRSILQKKELKKASCIDENGNHLSCHGSVKSNEPNQTINEFTALLVSYRVLHKLIKEMESYPLEKFRISIDIFPEYLYRKDKLFHHMKTGVILPYFKVYIKW